MTVFDTAIDELLATGVDGRIDYDARTGLNVYGSSIAPRPAALHFASSTASAPTPKAFVHLDRVRQTLARATGRERPDRVAGRALEALKGELADRCGLAAGSGTEIVLTGSGTEALLIAGYLARVAQRRPTTVVLVGPDETGTGVADALLGRHFTSRTPLGVSVTKGADIPGACDREIEIETVALRAGNGRVRGRAELDAEVAEIAGEIVASGRHALVCLQDSSKTGLLAPTPRLAATLKARHGERLDVIVDACQMRLSRARLGAYLATGVMVTISGSKFFGAPPFCGAILVPAAVAETCRAGPPLPRGLCDYAARDAWPLSWERICRRLPNVPLPGLLLRWHAAVFEMERFQRVPPARRARAVDAIRNIAGHALSSSAWVLPVPIAAAAPAASLARSWDRLPTIFPFFVLSPGEDEATPCPVAEARAWHRRLNENRVRYADPGAPHPVLRALSTSCHLGQPVLLPCEGGTTGGALRLAISASTITDLADDTEHGPSFDARLERVNQDIHTVFRKIGLLATRSAREGLDRGRREPMQPQTP